MTGNEYKRITVNGKDYYLLKQPDGAWLFTQRTPPIEGVSPEILTFKTEDDSISVSTNDERLAKAVARFVATENTPMAQRMLNYYPSVVKELLEYQALMQTLGFEIDFFRSEIILTFHDAFLTTMSENRLIEWEQVLDIVPNGDFNDRRDAIVARFRGGYKLNSDSINSIVNAFTGGRALSHFRDSTIYIQIVPPPKNKQFVFENVERELKRRIPAHLNYSVTRAFSSWNEIAEDFDSWNDVTNSFDDWESVRLYVRQIA